jgi:hypothetical protein
MFCSEGFTARGEVRLAGAHIGGILFLDHATLANPGGRALRAVGLTVDEHIMCDNGLSVRGEVDLRGARIDGNVYFNEATLANPGGRALNAARITVGQSVLLKSTEVAGYSDPA